MQLARCQAFESACAVVRFVSLTTAQLAEYNDMGHKSTPFFFYFHHIIHVTSILLVSCYHARCLHQPHCHPYQYRTHRILLDVIHAAGILFSSTSYSSYRIVQLLTVPVSCTNNSRSLLTVSPRHICYHLCQHQPHRHLH